MHILHYHADLNYNVLAQIFSFPVHSQKRWGMFNLASAVQLCSVRLSSVGRVKDVLYIVRPMQTHWEQTGWINVVPKSFQQIKSMWWRWITIENWSDLQNPSSTERNFGNVSSFCLPIFNLNPFIYVFFTSNSC